MSKFPNISIPMMSTTIKCLFYILELQCTNPKKAKSSLAETKNYYSIFPRFDRSRDAKTDIKNHLFSIDQQVLSQVSRPLVVLLEHTKTKTQIHIKCVLNSNILIHKNMTLTNLNMTPNMDFELLAIIALNIKYEFTLSHTFPHLC